MRFGILLLALLIIASPAMAASQAEADCDRLAGWSGDKTKPANVPGVEFKDIHPERAVPTCRDAVKEHPSPRMYYQLARALDAQLIGNEGIEWYRKAAEGGHLKAMVQLGFAYSSYLKDPKQAFFWYKKAADTGDPLGQQGLGTLYRDGNGVPKNDAEALRLFKLSADQGAAEGQYALAWMHYNGRGVPVDMKKAFALYKKAADQKDAGALYAIGSMYENGNGVAEDHWKAVNYFARARDSGNADAEKELFRMHEQYIDTAVQNFSGSRDACVKLCEREDDQCGKNVADALFCMSTLDYCNDKCSSP